MTNTVLIYFYELIDEGLKMQMIMADCSTPIDYSKLLLMSDPVSRDQGGVENYLLAITVIFQLSRGGKLSDLKNIVSTTSR